MIIINGINIKCKFDGEVNKINTEEFNKYFEINNMCPKCKSKNIERKLLQYDDGEYSTDIKECKCFDCGWEWLLV